MAKLGKLGRDRRGGRGPPASAQWRHLGHKVKNWKHRGSAMPGEEGVEMGPGRGAGVYLGKRCARPWHPQNSPLVGMREPAQAKVGISAGFFTVH